MTPKRVVLAPDSFKGTMTSGEVCEIIGRAFKAHIPDAQIVSLPVADGGEGLVDACLSLLGGERIRALVTGPRGDKMNADYALLPGGDAVIEMAACAGLPLMGDRKDPMRATTFGVGELLLDAAARGAKSVLLGLGGSATNDLGIGMASALGYAFLDKDGEALEPLALNLSKIEKIVPSKEKYPLKVTAACDVNNPLYGEHGAAYTFGRQKGADDETLKILDDGLRHMENVLKESLGFAGCASPGAGAAGGLGAGVAAYLGGELKPGIELLLDAAKFDQMLHGADLVVTGEGRIDWQTAHGKVPSGIARRAQKQMIPCIALCGAIGEGVEAVYETGITAVFSAVRGACTFEEIRKTCRDDLYLLADAVVRTLLIR